MAEMKTYSSQKLEKRDLIQTIHEMDLINRPYMLICQYTSEGYINAYDKMPDHDCDVNVIDHNGNRFKARCEYNKFGTMVFSGKSKGYDICWWKEITR